MNGTGLRILADRPGDNLIIHIGMWMSQKCNWGPNEDFFAENTEIYNLYIYIYTLNINIYIYVYVSM